MGSTKAKPSEKHEAKTSVFHEVFAEVDPITQGEYKHIGAIHKGFPHWGVNISPLSYEKRGANQAPTSQSCQQHVSPRRRGCLNPTKIGYRSEITGDPMANRPIQQGQVQSGAAAQTLDFVTFSLTDMWQKVATVWPEELH